MLELAIDRPVRVSSAVHAQPAERQGVRFRKRAHAHDGRRHRDLGGFGKLNEFFARVAGDNAAAAIEHRALGLLDQPDDFIQRHIVGLFVRVVTAQIDLLGKHRLRALLLHILGNVNDHRAGPSRLRDVERLFHNPRNVIHVRDQVTVFHDRQRQAENVGLLERAFADHVLRHLARDGDDRNGIEVGVREAGDEVRRAGTAGGHAHPGPPGGPGVTFRGKRAALFVPGEDSANFLRPRQRLVQLHARAAGIGENGVHPFAFERGDQDVAPLHRRADLGPFVGRGRFRFGRRFAHGTFCIPGQRNRGQRKNPRPSPAVGSCQNCLMRDKPRRHHQRRPPGPQFAAQSESSVAK